MGLGVVLLAIGMLVVGSIKTIVTKYQARYKWLLSTTAAPCLTTGCCLARLMLCSSHNVRAHTAAAHRQDITVTGHDAATGEVLTFKHPAVQSAFMFLGERAHRLVALLQSN